MTSPSDTNQGSKCQLPMLFQGSHQKRKHLDLNVQVHEVCPQFSSGYLQKIKTETTKDTELITLRNMVTDGWPTSIKKVTSVLQPYWTFRDKITIEDSLCFKGQRIIIPAMMQHDVLSRLHASHQGAEKNKLRARSSVFWVNLNKDIDELTKASDACQEFQRSQPGGPLIPSDIPPRTWHTITTDLFYYNEDEYLLIADYFSKFQFVRKIPRGYSNSNTVVDLMKQIFGEHGIPEIVRSDNGLRSHNLSTDDRRELRRNRSQIENIITEEFSLTQIRFQVQRRQEMRNEI